MPTTAAISHVGGDRACQPDAQTYTRGRDQSIWCRPNPVSDQLCGEHQTPGLPTNEIVILDDRGHLLERRTVVPTGDKVFAETGFGLCRSWHEGVLLIGASDGLGSSGHSRFVYLNEAGVEQWHSLVEDANAPIDAQDTAQESLVYSAGIFGPQSIPLVRITPRGYVVARRTVQGTVSLDLRTVQP